MSGSLDKNKQQLIGSENRYDVRCRRQWNFEEHNRSADGEDLRIGSRPLLQYNHCDTSTHPCRNNEMTLLQHGYLDCHGYCTIDPTSAPYSLQPQPTSQVPAAHPINNPMHQKMNYNYKPSPTLSRGGLGTIMGANAFQHKSSQETSLSVNTDELVMKIGATFPTVSDTHIRCLLKKYHNREAVVMSALQVEKHPIATPGPHSTSLLIRNSSIPSNSTPFQMTPPISVRGTPSTSIRRNMITPSMLMYGSVGTPPLGVWGTPPTRGSSPVLRPGSGSSYYSSPAFGDNRQSPKSQSSPKMKLRYLKSVFPKVDETLLLDTLISENNNVMKTSEKLKFMGFEKKEINKVLEKKQQNDICKAIGEKLREVEIEKPTPPPRMKSLEEKNRMKARLAGLYDEIPEKLIQIAIESVNYDEEKARHLLMLMINEEKENKVDINNEKDLNKIPSDKLDQEIKNSALKKLQNSLKEEDKKKQGSEKKVKTRKDVVKVSRGTSTTEDKEFKSVYSTKVTGRNRDLRRGPNDQLLLTDYMTWHGPNPELRSGANKSLTLGPNKNLLSENRTVATGPKKENCKGPMLGLAKGSIYSHLTMTLKG